MVLLTTVEACFDVPGRGSWIVPRPWDIDSRIREKDRIQLRTPDGKTLDTSIGGIEFLSGPSGSRLAIGLPRDLAGFDVPVGTEIWLVQGQAT